MVLEKAGKIGLAKVSDKGMLYLTKGVMEALNCCKGDVIVFHKDEKSNIFIQAIKEDEILGKI